MWWTILPVLILPMSQGRMDCSKSEYERCIRIADPLVKEAHLVFPDNMRDIEQVCKTWNQFVDCLKVYTDECFTAQQRKQFNRAVESPIESVHQMCMQPGYQRADNSPNVSTTSSIGLKILKLLKILGTVEPKGMTVDSLKRSKAKTSCKYLQHAPCIKNTIIERIHCGPQYNLLVDQVEQGDIISKSTLCCSHDRFKQCVVRETRRLCDRGVADGPASRFAGQIIDKALSFLRDQCYNYIPNSGDCTATPSESLPRSNRSDPLTISTSPSEIYPWSTIQQEAPRERLPSRVTPPRITTSSTWLPSSNSPTNGDPPSTDFFPTKMLGSRSRPSSWSRSSGWSDSTPQVAGNTVPLYPDVPPTPSSTQVPQRDEWAVTRTAWDVRGQQPAVRPGGPSSTSYPYQTSPSDSQFETTPMAWYPAAGNQLSNEVDEPNQLGLKNLRNMATTTSGTISLIVLIILRVFL